MTRVSDNSIANSIKYSLNNTKSQLEDIQLKGTTLKSLRKPSDNPIASIEALSLSSRNNDNSQYLKNASSALSQLNATEDALIEITDSIMKVKDIAIQQSSDFYNDKIRKSIANEIHEIKNHILSIANKRIGNRYIFAGYKTLNQPFDSDGKYSGDNGHMTVEVSKDFFVPINLTGEEVFFYGRHVSQKEANPLDEFPLFDKSRNKLFKETDPLKLKLNQEFIESGRELASDKQSNQKSPFRSKDNFIALLSTLESALINNQPDLIKGLLDPLDRVIDRIITLRTKIGSISTNIQNSINSLEMDTINNKTRRSHLVDADIMELFSDLTKQNDILKATYQMGNAALSQSLLDFLR